MSRPSAILALLLAALLVAPPQRARAVSCMSVYFSLSPCLESINDGGPPPSGECCDGIRSVVSDAKTADHRRESCDCLKSVAGGASGSRVENAAALPAKCGVSVPFVISPNTDCDKVQ